MKLTYSSNNSGGSWWLTDDNWRAMEFAGWTVNWVATDPFYASFGGLREGRWLGALATSAVIEVADQADADRRIAEWEALTGQWQHSEGCECCGRPHYFGLDGDAQAVQP